MTNLFIVFIKLLTVCIKNKPPIPSEARFIAIDVMYTQYVRLISS
jgi:hypothetical protein